MIAVLSIFMVLLAVPPNLTGRLEAEACGEKERTAVRLTLEAAEAMRDGRAADENRLLWQLAELLHGDRNLTDLVDYWLGAVKDPGPGGRMAKLKVQEIALRMGERGQCVLALIKEAESGP